MSHPYSDISELAQAGNSFGVIRIPTEQDVPFTRRVRAIVDTAEFQRLRQVTQLALASHVYPGATHTRFEHALGVYHNALRYLWQLGSDAKFAAIVSRHDAEVLIVAALLHDIGHWPFCHPIEDMELPQMPPHEVFAKEFLRPDGELTKVLESQWNVSAEVLDVLVAKSNSPSNRLRRSILSGPIDIDKMDYLARDSQHCGVPYGRHFDRNRLINSLIVNEAGDGLAITSKGRTAAEMMVFARYVMFTEVYWHHAVRSATTMFARSFLELMPKLDLSSLFRMSEPELIRCLCTTASGSDVAAAHRWLVRPTPQIAQTTCGIQHLSSGTAVPGPATAHSHATGRMFVRIDRKTRCCRRTKTLTHGCPDRRSTAASRSRISCRCLVSFEQGISASA